jgi:hypothetical protein
MRVFLAHVSRQVMLIFGQMVENLLNLVAIWSLAWQQHLVSFKLF